MPAFFGRAKTNEALIFETLGVPILVARRWSIIPFPCCQVTRPFNVGQCNIHFEGEEVMTKDKKRISLICSVKFIIDTTSKRNIMKAYKEFCGNKTNKCRLKKVTDIECAIIDIIYECMMEQLLKMTLIELIQFNWLFVDSVFTKVKYVLMRNCVQLQELNLMEIKEFTETSHPIEYQEENIYEEEVELALGTESWSVDSMLDGIKGPDGLTVLEEGDSATEEVTENNNKHLKDILKMYEGASDDSSNKKETSGDGKYNADAQEMKKVSHYEDDKIESLIKNGFVNAHEVSQEVKEIPDDKCDEKTMLLSKFKKHKKSVNSQ